MLLDDDGGPLFLDDIEVDALLLPGGAPQPVTPGVAPSSSPVTVPQTSPFTPLSLGCPSLSPPPPPLAASILFSPSPSSPPRATPLLSVPSTSTLSTPRHHLLPPTSQLQPPAMARGSSVSSNLPIAVVLASPDSAGCPSPCSGRALRHAPTTKRYRQTHGRSFDQKCAILESFYGRRQPLKWGQWRATADRVADPAIGRKEVKDFLASLALSYAEHRAGKDRPDVVLLLRSVTEQVSNHFKRQWRLSKHAQPSAPLLVETSTDPASLSAS
jgi:hypothetical protein